MKKLMMMGYDMCTGGKIMHLNPAHQNVKSCVRYLCRASIEQEAPLQNRKI